MRHSKLTIKSFTLIEMLIVIVIIGILAAALVPRLRDVQGRARDTKRKADIAQIHNALLIFHTDNSIYPKPTNSSFTTGTYNGYHYVYSTQGTRRIVTLTGILDSLPQDPINNGNTAYDTTGQYTYRYGNNRKDGKTFWMVAKLENTKDADRCEVQGYSWYSQGSILSCSNPVQCTSVFCRMFYGRSDLGP